MCNMICSNLEIKNNILFFGGRSTVELAEKYGSPLYVMDEQKIRENCRKYVNGMKKYFGENARPFYASKACSFKKIYNIVESEGMGVDVVSVGEIYTALKSGYNMKNVCFHSNSKNDYDINFAMDCGVGCFVVDNMSTNKTRLNGTELEPNVSYRIKDGDIITVSDEDLIFREIRR